MIQKRLSGVKMKRESNSYTEALYTVLKKANYYNGPKYRLAGMTGITFKFISHKKLLAPSVYIYSLDTDSWKAVDRLGIYNEVYWGFKNNPTFPLYQKKTIQSVKESIDRDIPVIFWEPGGVGFAVISGYDEEDEVFFYQDWHHEEDQILLFSNVGKVGAASWLYQIIGESIEKDMRDIYLESLECCIDEWEISDNVSLYAKNEFGCGGRAYDYTIAAFEGDDFSEMGALFILNNAIITKKQASLYFQEIKNEFTVIEEVAVRYKNVSDIFCRIGEMIPSTINRKNKINRANVPALIDCLKQARIEEELAVKSLKLFLKETLNNRHIDLFGEEVRITNPMEV